MSAERDPRPRPLSTLYARMLVPFAATLVLGTIVAWWIGTTLLSATLESRVAAQLHHAVELLAEPGFPVVEPVLQRLDKLLLASIFLLDGEGRLQSYSGTPPGEDLRSAVAQQYRRYSGPGAEEFGLRSGGRAYLLVLREIAAVGQSPARVLAACADLSDVRAATRRGGQWLAGLTFSGISLLAFIGFRISRSITGPVAGLAAMAAAIAAGDRGVRVNVSRDDEVGALAQSLNTMAARLEEFEQQMVERSRLATLGELSARVAHEIRNPLTAIKMQLQLLADELSPAARSRLAELLDEVARLELIVTGTLEMARPDGLNLQPTDINQLLAEVLRLQAPRFEHLQISTRVALAPGLPNGMLDPARVKQIVINLLNNAADELCQGGLISVRTALDDDGALVLEIADSGSGVPRERREQLFQGGSSSKATGLGLGLRVSRELVELHGGSIELTESDLGGALFRVFFPVEN